MLFVFQKETSGDNLSVAFFVEGVVYENRNKEIFIFKGTPASATPLESHRFSQNIHITLAQLKNIFLRFTKHFSIFA